MLSTSKQLRQVTNVHLIQGATILMGRIQVIKLGFLFSLFRLVRSHILISRHNLINLLQMHYIQRKACRKRNITQKLKN